MKHAWTITLAAALIGITVPAVRADEAGKFTVGLGADYSSGKYGGTQSTDISYFSLFGRYERDRWTLKLTLPWLRITGPGSVAGGDRPIVVDANANQNRVTVSGMGDAVAAVTYTLYEAPKLLVDATGKVKLPTGSKDEGLGTGKADYVTQVDAYVTVAPGASLFTGVGYRVFGDPDGSDFNNVFFASFGGTYRVLPSVTAGVSLDYRQAVLDGRDSMREATPFVIWKATDRTKFQVYVVRGFTNASAPWGGGMVLMQSF